MQTLLGGTYHTINFAVCNLPKGCKLLNVLTSAWVSSWFEFVLFFFLKQEVFGFRAKWRDWCTSYTRAALSLFEPVNLPPDGVKNDPQPCSQVHLRVSPWLDSIKAVLVRIICWFSSFKRVLKHARHDWSYWVCEYSLFENNDTKTQRSETFNFKYIWSHLAITQL